MTQRYVELLIGHGKAYVEASSNGYLLGEHRLSAADEELLVAIGWIAPKTDVDDPERFAANWTLPLVVGDWDALVEVLLAAITCVFGFDEQVPVEMRSFPADHPCREWFPEVAA